MVGHGRASNVGVKPFAEEEDDMVVDYHGQWHSNTDVMLEASSYRILSPSWFRSVVFAAEMNRQQWADV